MSDANNQSTLEQASVEAVAPSPAPSSTPDPAPSPAPDALAELRDAAFSFADFAQDIAESLLRPWIAYQVVIAACIFVLAHFVSAMLKPRFHSWMRAREGGRLNHSVI